MASSAKNRPRHRFGCSLRALLIAATLSCVVFGVIVNRVRREREAVKALQYERVIMLFDYHAAGQTDPPGPAWLRNWIGDELFADVEMLGFTVPMLGGPVSESVNDDLLVHLRSLPRVKGIMLDGCKDITDQGLMHLEYSYSLEKLHLSETNITGTTFDALCNLHNLKTLDLQSTRVVDASLAKLVSHKQLEELWLADTTITDDAVPYLEQLTGLEELDLALTKITPKGLQRLRTALPNCEILAP